MSPFIINIRVGNMTVTNWNLTTKDNVRGPLHAQLTHLQTVKHRKKMSVGHGFVFETERGNEESSRYRRIFSQNHAMTAI